MKAVHFFRNLLVLLLISAAVIYVLPERLQFNKPLLHGGNLLLVITTALSFRIASGGNPTNPHGFVRSIYSGTLLKLFAIAAAAGIYIFMVSGAVHTPSLGILAVLYILYSGLETYGLQKLSRKGPAGPQA
ncbi:MAG: hypothetical protein EOP52_11300 [Sphingobacteriales bacterium]|nr:MAG: hypothetical protein EOP52_11300 [Sphingobacteriales bacterium]